MKLTTLYPTYFPSLHWWQKAYASDFVILLDDQSNPRLGHLNRCFIKSTEGKLGLSVPVFISKGDSNILNELDVDPTKNWFRTHQASLISNYSNAPYFKQYFPYMEDFYSKQWKKILDIYLESVNLILKLLRLNKKFYYHSQCSTSGTKEDRVIQLLEQFKCNSYIIEAEHKNYFDSNILKKRGFKIENITQNKFEYEQQFNPFIPGLSILDCLFNEGPYGVKLIQGRTIYREKLVKYKKQGK